jgi:hypothetical protein
MAKEPPPIVDTILGDIAALVPQFSSIVASYRLLIGGAEELRRMKGICPEIIDRAVVRADRAGALIDMLLEILCTKVSFSTNFLAVSSAPVDVFRLLSPAYSCDPSRLTAEQIVELEALRQVLCRERSALCFADKTAGPCPFIPNSNGAPPDVFPSDIAETIQTELTQDLSNIVSPRDE